MKRERLIQAAKVLLDNDKSKSEVEIENFTNTLTDDELDALWRYIKAGQGKGKSAHKRNGHIEARFVSRFTLEALASGQTM